MRYLSAFLFILLIGLVTLPGAAQDETTSCDPAVVAETLDSVNGILADIDHRFDTDSAIALRADIRLVESILEELKQSCFVASPTPQPVTYYIISNQNVNARSCPRTSCGVVTVISPGDAISVVGTQSGDTVSGRDEWYQINTVGQPSFIHSSLASQNRPPTPAPRPTTIPAPVQPQPTQPPAQQPQQSQPPENQSVAPPAPQFSCSCSKTCEQMASCEEAYFQLNQCGCGRRDGDGDGVPCESICPGG